MSVLESVEADLAEIAKADPALAKSGLAATAIQLAKELDGNNSATSKSMCANSLMKALGDLRQLAPEEATEDRVDELASKREKRRAKAS